MKKLKKALKKTGKHYICFLADDEEGKLYTNIAIDDDETFQALVFAILIERYAERGQLVEKWKKFELTCEPLVALHSAATRMRNLFDE